MSDFASFVAASLRDKAMAELLQENAKLREKLQESKRVTITGPGGAPLYAYGSLNDSEVEEEQIIDESGRNMCLRSTTLDLRSSSGENADATLTMCQIEGVKDAEIRLGGIPLYICGRSADEYSVSGRGNRFENDVYAFQTDEDDNSPVTRVGVQYGPVSERPQDSYEYANDEIEQVRFTFVTLEDYHYVDNTEP